MAKFEKGPGQSKKGWDDKKNKQVVGLGESAEISLRDGADFHLNLTDEKVCTVHERPGSKDPHLRQFVITGLTKGETIVGAHKSGIAMMGSMTTMRVEVTGSQHGFRLVFFPGERIDRNTGQTLGTIYAVGGGGERFSAAGGPAAGYDKDQGGHTADPTPAGHYVLGPRQHVTTTSWPMSVIPWDAPIQINEKTHEAEYKDENGRWRVATGPNGEVTRARIQYENRSRGKKMGTEEIIALVRRLFIDPATGKLRDQMHQWKLNDFGKWGWNLQALPSKTPTAYYVHTTDSNEKEAEAKKSILLENSHGCVHLVPSQRDEMMDKGYLKEGVEFEVRPYSEVGPP